MRSTLRASVRVGTGGWQFPPWRGVFYPEGLSQARELEYASRRLGAIEINSTFYRSPPAATFAKWREQTPEGFVFSVKAPRFATHRKVLAEAGDAVARFVAGGLTELGSRLGPIVWQLPSTRRFDAEDIRGFLDLLPRAHGGCTLRHAIEARHQSFADAAFVALARDQGVAIVLDDSDEFPQLADVCADFVYARLMRSVPHEPAGYSPAALDAWAARARIWAQGRVPADLPRLAAIPKRKARDVFVFFIAGAKERAPAAAGALIERLQRSESEIR